MKLHTLSVLLVLSVQASGMFAASAKVEAPAESVVKEKEAPMPVQGVKWAPHVQLTDDEKKEFDALMEHTFLTSDAQVQQRILNLPKNKGDRAVKLLYRATPGLWAFMRAYNNPNAINVSADLIGGLADVLALGSEDARIHKAAAAGDQIASLLGARPNLFAMYNAGWRFKERLNRLRRAQEIAIAIKNMKRQDRTALKVEQIIAGGLLGLEGIARLNSLRGTYLNSLKSGFAADLVATIRRALVCASNT